ncbi:unnamed protein product [Meloidogyne enterolobii]|uniref:Uncharacterized protein n=1 Tax=Meloidogyne enterolobii TaxID=390850 RepID=A0ACB0Y972_MELEN
MEEIFDWDWENKNEGLGYNYYTALSPAELKKLKKEKEFNKPNLTVTYLEGMEEHLSENNEEENMENKEVFNKIKNKMIEDNMEEENEEKDGENIKLEESTTMKTVTEEKKKGEEFNEE